MDLTLSEIMTAEWYDASSIKKIRIQEGFTGYNYGQSIVFLPDSGYWEEGVYPSTFSAQGGGYSSTFTMLKAKHRRIYLGSSFEMYMQLSNYWGAFNTKNEQAGSLWFDPENAELFINQEKISKISESSAEIKVPYPATLDFYSDLKEIVFSDEVKEVRGYSCAIFPELEKVSFGRSVKFIGVEAFIRCNSLKVIIIPESVTEISSFAFSQCNSLEEVRIEATDLKLKHHVFYMDYTIPKSFYLLNATIADDTPSIKVEGNAFIGITAGSKIIFKDQETAEAYKQATNWTNYADYITYEGAEE